MNVKPQIWYSFSGQKAKSNQVGFYDTGQFDWVVYLESNFTVIKEELLAYINSEKEDIKPYFNKNLVTKKSIWRTSAFLFWNLNFKKNQKLCPTTMEVLKGVPNLISASVSILEPGSEIKPHRGDTNGIMRGHLPLVVPQEKNELGFKVGEQTVVWEEGKLLLFNDAEYHSAWNHANTDRIVMIIDVVRPEFASFTYRISSTILSSLLYQNMSIKVGLVKKFPQVVKNFLIKVLALIINPILRFQNR